MATAALVRIGYHVNKVLKLVAIEQIDLPNVARECEERFLLGGIPHVR